MILKTLKELAKSLNYFHKKIKIVEDFSQVITITTDPGHVVIDSRDNTISFGYSGNPTLSGVLHPDFFSGEGWAGLGKYPDAELTELVGEIGLEESMGILVEKFGTTTILDNFARSALIKYLKEDG